MNLYSAVSRRVMIHAHVSRTIDELAAVRAANGTPPDGVDDRVDLIRARARGLDATSDGFVDELLGLAADVHGLLEHLSELDIEGAV